MFARFQLWQSVQFILYIIWVIFLLNSIFNNFLYYHFTAKCSPTIVNNLFNIDPDETITFRQLIQSRGFHLQEHYVLTEDGYILTIHRVVPAGIHYQSATYNLYRKPVIAVHGIFVNSQAFYINSPFIYPKGGLNSSIHCGDNFGFCMVLTGRYDLWVVNSRGNGISNGHIHYKPDDNRFWRFSWDHMALFDLPAVIDHIRIQTGHQTVGYIGYSQGSAQMFALLSLQPHYAHVIRPFISWGPAVFINGATSLTAPALRNGHQITNKPGRFPFFHQWMIELLQWQICRPSPGKQFCVAIYNALVGKSNLNTTRIPTYLYFALSSCSNWQIAHFGQNGQSGRFRRFNYPNEAENFAMYGSRTAPDYPLWNIPKHLKLIIMYGPSDSVIVSSDVHRLITTLRKFGNQVIEYRVPTKIWSHADFLIGIDAGRLVYDETLRMLDLYAW